MTAHDRRPLPPRLISPAAQPGTPEGQGSNLSRAQRQRRAAGQLCLLVTISEQFVAALAEEGLLREGEVENRDVISAVTEVVLERLLRVTE